MDAAYYKGVGSTTAKATDKLTSILADMNMIYQFQMNIFLVAKETLLKKTASNSPSWNSGCVGIENHLTQLKGWAGSQTDLSAAGTKGGRKRVVTYISIIPRRTSAPPVRERKRRKQGTNYVHGGLLGGERQTNTNTTHLQIHLHFHLKH